MAKISFSPRAHCKIILHAAKYPHCAINGLLLAKEKKGEGKSGDLHVEDAIPLFHQCLHVSPMSEIALGLVDQFATQNGMVIAGYYLANELLNDLSTDKPAHRIADKIADHFGNAVIAVIDNREFSHNMSTNLLRVSQFQDGKWKLQDKADIIYEGGEAIVGALESLLREERYQQLIDFDNHLDNISLDWHNSELNKIIKKTVSVQ
ncbi:ER membrane protein complex subunit 8 [Diachasma alloeum]|uniref:ER membrane protein complex subunit 8 n=1 Tax=Diachasma alloeum TaxID=454923 RepID=UPI0007381CD4|nr:ER membrane protein complex subunit 8 [Diachasma alloeum]XP_015111901.1 ER membrane protein complex subunit 8 [Diachasma alloeum]XP_015111902.1 ER membrane protein complex subunit 8 [Diachasma alloeum]